MPKQVRGARCPRDSSTSLRVSWRPGACELQALPDWIRARIQPPLGGCDLSDTQCQPEASQLAQEMKALTVQA